MPRFREMTRDAGRGELPVTIGNAPADLDRLKRLRDLGAAPANLRLPAEPAAAILPILDRWAELIQKLR
jgi:hypothetical protein